MLVEVRYTLFRVHLSCLIINIKIFLCRSGEVAWIYRWRQSWWGTKKEMDWFQNKIEQGTFYEYFCNVYGWQWCESLQYYMYLIGLYTALFTAFEPGRMLDFDSWWCSGQLFYCASYWWHQRWFSAHMWVRYGLFFCAVTNTVPFRRY